jgi:glycosyltransferase involved in cell wall biosynthesis
MSLFKPMPTVSIVIPIYKKTPEQIDRAIGSAREQEYHQLEKIVAVNDGSPNGDEVRAVVAKHSQEDKRVVLLDQHNMGVAHARNNGIASVTSTYICCLDADDALKPEFLKVCVAELEKDRSLGIVYTGLYATTPDGQEGMSQWPGEFNYDAQLRKQNQIPTACVFRREMWERLGGYKARYSPGGAGAEDAEFWLRAGAYGWGAKKATTAGLFLYSWKSGLVSGDKSYREPDWLAWHPWTKDKKHPFASVATPEKQAHPVRQYDEPQISVVIPVGNGHEELVKTALDSLEAQTFRNWEAVVIWGSDKEPELTAYPYARLLSSILPGDGAGQNRNFGATVARGDMLLFLDADDLLLPNALSRMLEAWSYYGMGIYTDYYGRAIIDKPEELAANLKDRIDHVDEHTGETVIKYRAEEYDCVKASEQPQHKPYLWNTICTLIPKQWHIDVGGFDTRMGSWEDVDYWWRMAWMGKCFKRLPERLMVYKFHTGHRRQDGIDNFRTLFEYIQEKKERITVMGCGCKETENQKQQQGAGFASSQMESNMQKKDDDYVLVKYMHPNRGKHGVRGGATREYYGYRSGGSTMLVHRQDIAAQPHLFIPIQTPPEVQVTIPQVQPEPPKPIIAEPEEEAVRDLDLQTLPGVTPSIARNMQLSGLVSEEIILRAGYDGLVAVSGIADTRAKMILEYLERDDS